MVIWTDGQCLAANNGELLTIFFYMFFCIFGSCILYIHVNVAVMVLNILNAYRPILKTRKDHNIHLLRERIWMWMRPVGKRRSQDIEKFPSGIFNNFSSHAKTEINYKSDQTHDLTHGLQVMNMLYVFDPATVFPCKLLRAQVLSRSIIHFDDVMNRLSLMA